MTIITKSIALDRQEQRLAVRSNLWSHGMEQSVVDFLETVYKYSSPVQIVSCLCWLAR